MHLQSFHGLFIHELKDLYDAEHQILEALPKIIDAVSSEKLKEALEAHRKQTEMHVKRLNDVFGSLGEKPARVTCTGMRGLLDEGEETMNEKDAVLEVRDAALIEAAQKVEHYEIGAYGTLCAFARLMGHDDALDLLSETLEEEKDADEKLSEIAEHRVNPAAMEAAPGMEKEMAGASR
jgi:ferritin-like metal-binding protein YciE